MFLYHYAVKKHNKLRTLASRGIKSDIEFENDGSEYKYNEHISFFFEPIPRNLPQILHNEHDFWVKGRKLYEHIIDINQLPEDILYRIVETRQKTELVMSQDWDLVTVDTLHIKDKYLKEINDLEVKMLFVGKGRASLKMAILNAEPNIIEDYKFLYEMAKKYPEDKLLEKYAALVPHLMAYLGKVDIVPMEIKEITLK